MGSLVVAVSGTSGAGKSTLVGDLSERLRGLALWVETVHFDDFTGESDLPRGDVSGWVARGGRPGEWRAEGMERHLLGLVASCTSGGERDEAASVVLVEEPFGRARPGLGRLVDLSVHLQVPLHLALARRLLREFVPLLVDWTSRRRRSCGSTWIVTSPRVLNSTALSMQPRQRTPT